MRILINTEPLPPPSHEGQSWYWDPKKPITGTVKFYVRVAEELTKLGHKVFVTYDGPSLDHNGVLYASKEAGNPSDLDVVLDCNTITEAIGDERRLHWTSLFRDKRFLTQGSYHTIFMQSDYLASTILGGASDPRFVKLPLGCDSLFVPFGSEGFSERLKQVCYTSSPDRGGNTLLQIWPQIMAATGYQLKLSGYSDANNIEELYLNSRFWIHPALGVELHCLSGLEAQQAGCIPIYVPHMALAETIRYGVKVDLARFQEQVITALRAVDHAQGEAHYEARKRTLTANPVLSWKEVVSRIETEFNRAT